MNDERSLTPDTTREQDKVVAGQRRINLIWEYTQAFLALYVTIVVTALGVYLSVKARPEDLPPFLTLTLGLIIGFYFQRTNHHKTGGIGKKTGDDR